MFGSSALHLKPGFDLRSNAPHCPLLSTYLTCCTCILFAGTVNWLFFAAGGVRLWNKTFNLLFLSISLLYIWNRTYAHFLRLVPSVLPVVSVGREQTQQILCVLVCYVLHVSVCLETFIPMKAVLSSLFCQNVIVVKKKSSSLPLSYSVFRLLQCACFCSLTHFRLFEHLSKAKPLVWEWIS